MPEKTSSILLFQRIIPTYRKGVFQQFDHKLGIVSCYSPMKEKNGFGTGENLHFRTELLRKIQITKSQTTILQFPLSVLRKYRPGVVISEGAPSYLTLWLLFFLRFFFRYKLVLWTHGIKNKELEKPFQGISGKFRLFLFNKADGLILYSEKRKELLSNFLKDPAKIFVAPNTLNTEHLLLMYHRLKQEGKEEVKKELGWKKKLNLIFLGRLVESKNLGLFLKSIRDVQFDPELELHIIGDGSERNTLEKLKPKSVSLKFYGEEFDEEVLSRYLYASDLMIIPGQVGLSLVHAFCFGCPVLACSGEGIYDIAHGPEMEYLVNDYNGFILNDSKKNMADEIKSILLNKDLNLLAENAIKTIEEKATIHKMLDGFEQMLTFIQQKKA